MTGRDEKRTISSGIVMYLYQGRVTHNSNTLIAHCEDLEELRFKMSELLFTNIAKSLYNKSSELFYRINTNENLHIRHRLSNGECLYDSLYLNIPGNNKVLSVGNSERSFISVAIVHAELIYNHLDRNEFDPEFMYRRYLHLGRKPCTQKLYIKEGSLLWHAIYSKLLPQPVSNSIFYSSEYWKTKISRPMKMMCLLESDHFYTPSIMAFTLSASLSISAVLIP